jgi:hypothetical protein
MQSEDHALEIIDKLIKQASNTPFSYVAIKAKTIADILQSETNAEHHAMRTCCNALAKRFRLGQDFFRRGKNREKWHNSINGSETSTFEILFEINR